jgi:integrase
VLDWARAKKLRDGENPARWKGLLDKLPLAKSQVAPVEHHKALPYADLPHLMTELRRRDSLSARALEYTILTAARTSDTIKAIGAEIDREEGTWTVPPGRLKGKKGARKRAHVVPLCRIGPWRSSPPTPSGPSICSPTRPASAVHMAMLELLQGMGFGRI